MKRIFLLISLTLTLACHPTVQHRYLSAGNWDPRIQNHLNNLLDNYRDSGAYAVFDFDKTSIVHDVSQALWVYQVEHLRYADAPEHNFLDGIPDPSREIAPGVTFTDMGNMLEAEHERLVHKLGAGMSWEEVYASPEYLDFRARMATLLVGMDDVFGYEVSYLWMPGLLAGFTEEEAREVVREALEDQLGKDKLEVQEWTSPDGQWSQLVERGIWLSPEMKDLYHTLQANGITPYVCSASLELIVEVLACDPQLGIGLPEEQVFGLRFVPSERLVAQFDPTYVQPIGPGKVSCIKSWMAPSYEGRGPILVGGDSNGDVPMLTAFEDMQRGLIIDVGRRRETPIGELAAQARNHGRYLLQPCFAKAEGAVEGGGI
jgi:phosphoserine phosphatase